MHVWQAPCRSCVQQRADARCFRRQFCQTRRPQLPGAAMPRMMLCLARMMMRMRMRMRTTIQSRRAWLQATFRMMKAVMSVPNIIRLACRAYSRLCTTVTYTTNAPKMITLNFGVPPRIVMMAMVRGDFVTQSRARMKCLARRRR